MIEGGIYIIKSPTNKTYIGQTVNFKKRFNTYKTLRRESIGRRLYNSLVKHGVDNHQFIIAERMKDLSPANLDKVEKSYIWQYKRRALELLNLTNGGGGSSGYKHTPEALKKMSDRGKGRFAGDKNPNYGKGLAGEKNGMFGKKRPQELLDRLKTFTSKAVVKCSMDGVDMQEYPSAMEAARMNKVKNTNISACCRGTQKTCGGFKWRFK